jgi:hypothetical protein
MDVGMTPSLVPEAPPPRYPIIVSDRVTIVVMVLKGERVSLGIFVDGDLVHVVDGAAGSA